MKRFTFNLTDKNLERLNTLQANSPYLLTKKAIINTAISEFLENQEDYIIDCMKKYNEI